MQRIIGIIVGGLTIYLLLNVMEAVTKDTQPRYLLAVGIGMLIMLLWPWALGLFAARRIKERRDAEIQQEVDKQINAQKGG